MHFETFSTEKLKHDPIASMASQTLVVAIVNEPKLYDKIGSNLW